MEPVQPEVAVATPVVPATPLTPVGDSDRIELLDILRGLAVFGILLVNIGSYAHPFAVRRVSELMKWVHSGEYDRIMAGEYRKRDAKADAREEAGAATDYYSERFKTIFKEAGDGVSKAGDRAGETADKISEWLRKR